MYDICSDNYNTNTTVHEATYHMDVRQYACYVNVITASGSASRYASAMRRVYIGCESGVDWGSDQVITLSAKLGEGGFGARPHAACDDARLLRTQDIAMRGRHNQ